VHEVKHDGHRILAYVERGRVRLKTRAGNYATGRFAPITEILGSICCHLLSR
jgi:ATP-dependent DNA ligase